MTNGDKFNQFQEKLGNLDIESMAWEERFFIRKNRNKFTATAFVLSFFKMMQFVHLGSSLEKWAGEIAELCQCSFSKQALTERLGEGAVSFCRRLLDSLLRETLREKAILYDSPLFSFFGAVWIEDSSCFSLPRVLASAFPGAHSVSGKDVATARIQLCMDLKRDKCAEISIQSYRDNDQKHAPQIVSRLCPQDLVIRDLGYWSLNAMVAVCKAEAFVLTRYKYGVNLYSSPETLKSMDLHKTLQKAKYNQIQLVEIQVFVGLKQRLPLRLIALRVPEKQAQERRRKAKAERNTKANHSPEYFDLLDWTLLLTNVPKEVWTPKQAFEAYGFRWRIEIIFKCWKSKIGIQHLFEAKQSMTKHRVYISFYLALAWVILYIHPLQVFFHQKIWQKYQRVLSILKFIDLLQRKAEHFLYDNNLEKSIDWVARHCCYEKRKGRTGQIAALLNL